MGRKSFNFGRHSPQPHCAVQRARCQDLPVWREGHAHHGVCMPSDSVKQRAVRHHCTSCPAFPEANNLPSGEKTMYIPSHLGDSISRRSVPSSTLHNRIHWFHAPEASVDPSGEKATLSTCASFCLFSS